LLVAACDTRGRARISLDADARTPSPGFRIAALEAPRFIEFERTSDRPGRAGDPTIWRLVHRADTTITPPIHIVYGSVPPGYTAAAPAAMLYPASYRVRAKFTHSSGVRTFVVAPDGTVR
jgi:hypothetical protein